MCGPATLSDKKCSLLLIIVNYYQLQKRPKIWIWVQLLWDSNLIISNWNTNFSRKYQRIVRSWFAFIPSIDSSLFLQGIRSGRAASGGTLAPPPLSTPIRQSLYGICPQKHFFFFCWTSAYPPWLMLDQVTGLHAKDRFFSERNNIL